MAKLIIVDCEATGPCPSMGRLTEFGAVLFDQPPFTTRFHGICDPDVGDTMEKFYDWLGSLRDGGPVVLVSDNPAFDWQWINDAFWRALHMNPFGHSARRIGDYYAGRMDDYWNASGWKKYRKTKHDHNPVNDALGNAEALWYLLEDERFPYGNHL